jgi:hypothetical protein
MKSQQPNSIQGAISAGDRLSFGLKLAHPTQPRTISDQCSSKKQTLRYAAGRPTSLTRTRCVGEKDDCVVWRGQNACTHQ